MAKSDTETDIETPVLVVGAGPVGLVLATTLARRGVPCVLADAALEPTKFPKMDITNGRSMELLRTLGLADDVRAVGVPSEYSFDVVFATGLGPSGEEVGRWSLPSVDEARRIIAWCNDGSMPREPAQRCPQSRFEALLRTHCEADPLIDCRWGWRFESLDQEDGAVVAQFSTTATGSSGDEAGDQLERVSAQWLVGCDGASSQVRREVGIELTGAGGTSQLVMTHFRSRDTEVLHRFGRFWHVYLPLGAVIISQDEGDEYTVHCPDFSGSDELPDPIELLHQALGAPVEIDEVLLQSRWSPRLLLADRYRAGRVFLAGDSAHQVIPTGGYGMNTGLGDAFDLGWKLAAVVNGWGGIRLLDSYEAERRPVGEANRDRSARHVDVIVGWAGRAMHPTPELGQWLQDSRGENESFGIELDARYRDSPIIATDDDEPPWDPMQVTPGTWPGSRAPSVWLEDGSALFDSFGPGFTLVVSVDTAEVVEAWQEAAQARDLPLTVVVVTEPAVQYLYEQSLVLVRPDGYVAWRGDHSPTDPTQPADVLATVTGW